MDWRASLNDKMYVENDLLPALIKAAVESRSPRAIHVLGNLLLWDFVDVEASAHPLKPLYKPSETIYDLFPEDDDRKVWEKRPEFDLLQEFPDLLLDKYREVFVALIKDIKGRKRCTCPAHAGSQGESGQGHCKIPAVLLWERINDVLTTCDSGSSTAVIKGKLENLLKILECEGSFHLAQAEWWPAEEFGSDNKQRVWSRYRLVFFVNLASKLVDKALRHAYEGLGEQPITADDITACEQEMKRCWQEVKELMKDARPNQYSTIPTYQNLGTLTEQVDKLQSAANWRQFSLRLNQTKFIRSDWPSFERQVLVAINALPERLTWISDE